MCHFHIWFFRESVTTGNIWKFAWVLFPSDLIKWVVSQDSYSVWGAGLNFQRCNPTAVNIFASVSTGPQTLFPRTPHVCKLRKGNTTATLSGCTYTCFTGIGMLL